MLARILDTKIKRFGLVLIVLSLVPLAYTAVHHHLEHGFFSQITKVQLRPAKKPTVTNADIVLKNGIKGWAVLRRDCFEKKQTAWKEANGEKPMPLPRECATSYRMHETVSQTAGQFQAGPYIKRLTSTKSGYFGFLAAAALMFLTGLIMIIGLFDRVGRWIFWGE